MVKLLCQISVREVEVIQNDIVRLLDTHCYIPLNTKGICLKLPPIYFIGEYKYKQLSVQT
jgi:hypothetical protein